MSVAGVAHPVERHLAKVEVASSSLVTRSKTKRPMHSIGLFILAGKRLEKINASLRWRFACRRTRRRQHHNVSSLVTRSIKKKQMLMHLLLFYFAVMMARKNKSNSPVGCWAATAGRRRYHNVTSLVICRIT